MPKLQTYRELEVWQKAMDLVEVIYRTTEKFPKTEQYGLASQIQRAAVSIPSNIAEGYGRTHRGDYLRHLSFARGSLAELETQLTIAVRLGFTDKTSALPLWEMAQDIGKMLTRLHQSLSKGEGKKIEQRE